jgi:hypothetical protein
MEEPFRTLAVIAVPLILLIAGYYGSYYLCFKKKLSEFRACLDTVDDALKDNNVTEEEFSLAWDRCYAFFKKLSG